MRDSERAEWGFEWEVADERRWEFSAADEFSTVDEMHLSPIEWGFGVYMFGCEGKWECSGHLVIVRSEIKVESVFCVWNMITNRVLETRF